MMNSNAPPKEGDIYKVVKVDEYTFELRFGYYEDFERAFGEPVVVYPDLTKRRLYTKDGYPIVTAIQEVCSYYEVPEHKARDECCSDCIHYSHTDDEIGICKSKQSRINRT